MNLKHCTILAGVALANFAAAAEVGRVVVPEKKAVIVLSTADEQLPGIPLNKMVSLACQIQGIDGGEVPADLVVTAFDATMPQHSHGMVVVPKLTAQEAGKWRIDGVKLHMIGNWEISIVTQFDGKPHRYTIPYKL